MPELRHAWLRDYFAPEQISAGLRGLERETLRVDGAGRLAYTPHPRAIGAALTHPAITTDYSEALLEFVTPPFGTNAETLEYLVHLHAFVQRRLDGELMWPASMPCIGNADDGVPIADYGNSNEGMFRTVYRRGLGYRYGRAMQAIAGIHFNYSPPAAFWPALRDATAADSEAAPFRSERLMGLVRNYRRLAWVVAYLFGASPVITKAFRPAGHPRLESLDAGHWYAPYATSLRMSDLGYRNTTQAGPGISANSLSEYVAELGAAVSTPDPAFAAIGVEVDGEFRQLNANILQIENEYYSSIRPKPRDRASRPVTALARDGIEYVELRNLDSDPEALVGVDIAQMCLAELLLLLCLLGESPAIGAAEQAEIDRRELAVAWEGRRPGLEIERAGDTVALRDWGCEICDGLDLLAAHIGGEAYRVAAELARTAFTEPARTPSARMIGTLQSRHIGLREYALELAERHRRSFDALVLPVEREAEFVAMTELSLQSAAALEGRRGPDFAEYLRTYFGR